MQKLNELKTLRNLRPCLDSEFMFRVEGRLLNSELPIDTRQPFIIPSRHGLTRMIILHEHVQAGHAGPAYSLMQTRQQFWIIFGNGSVRHYLSDCDKCALRKAKLARQLLSDLPSFRVTKFNKPFQICGVDFLGPLLYRLGRSECKSWGLLFSSLNTRCLHVEIVTGLDLNNFLLAFSRFINLRGSVETIYSNGSTFCAAAKILPKILCSVEFNNSLRKQGINWIKIPPNAPSQGGAWESMVKLFKTTLYKVMDNARRLPTLIELQTFTVETVRIVNDRPLTTPSDQPNDLLPITPSCFLGQKLAPCTLSGESHDNGDLRRDYAYNSTLAHQFRLSLIKGYVTNIQGRKKWRATRENLFPGQLVLVGDSEDICKRGSYRIGRIHSVHPQFRNGKEIVRRATVAVFARNSDSGSNKLDYILVDVSKIAPV